ncbi:hypothetical protein D1BOALGB6SA_8145 [Olavius sp. associated proteobacterium Delta 1]|nr:hypothetical protein D1BOALGB6SA_8145 [Olavius sp. associated proteobacterium Delta 1]
MELMGHLVSQFKKPAYFFRQNGEAQKAEGYAGDQ